MLDAGLLCCQNILLCARVALLFDVILTHHYYYYYCVPNVLLFTPCENHLSVVHNFYRYFTIYVVDFYHAMLFWRGICCHHVSVCLSVTSQSSTKTAKPGITQITPYDSPRTLVVWCQKYRQNSNRITPIGGRQIEVG